MGGSAGNGKAMTVPITAPPLDNQGTEPLPPLPTPQRHLAQLLLHLGALQVGLVAREVVQVALQVAARRGWREKAGTLNRTL